MPKVKSIGSGFFQVMEYYLHAHHFNSQVNQGWQVAPLRSSFSIFLYVHILKTDQNFPYYLLNPTRSWVSLLFIFALYMLLNICINNTEVWQTVWQMIDML